jgi:F5/8 type C domain
MTGEAVGATGEAAARPTKERGRLSEWFWRGAALQKARAATSELPAGERQALERARLAIELADRSYDPVDPLRAGSSLALSVSLYREAAYWGLRAQSEAYSGATLGALLDSLPAELLAFAAGGAEALEGVRNALVERTFVDTAALAPELLARDALRARGFGHALVDMKSAPLQRVGAVLLQRAARMLGLSLVLVALAASASTTWAAMRRGPDLAAGKPWKASSSSANCRPREHSCAGVHTDMFFQTSEEPEPWLELDLGKDFAFNEVDVTNRADCCPDRAVPLAVEVSRDRKHWREVSRRADTFSTWEAMFERQTARYVRLRVLRRTIFHLDKVAVRNAR